MGKNVVITGSTRGIGFAMACEFLKAGCNVSISGRQQTLADDKHEILKALAGKYIYIPCNVQDKKSLQELWDLSAEKWGKVDIWINNAGQNAPYKFAWETEENYTYNVIQTNITGTIFGSQIAAVGMLKQKHGAIYSMEGLGSNDMIQLKTILYGTTKRALTYFMNGLAKELEGSGVIAGRLSPGMMLTDFITKDPDGNASEVITQENFKRIFNILADRPETVAAFFVPQILANTKNGKQIAWLTKRKALSRFLAAPFSKRKLLQ
ncbi:MAG: SDR family oxidoreductase [Peptococcaceae bacterium]|nr:SDR family oxidoreductase [Peptococcaceae bacterium]